MTEPSNQTQPKEHRRSGNLVRENMRLARRLLGHAISKHHAPSLEALSQDFKFSIRKGELQFLNNAWYVTHTGLVRLARRKKCKGIHVEAVDSLCDSALSRFVMKATVYPSKESAGFVGCGDADPSNVSGLVRGAELRIAETRAVNRALRKAYGVGICSVEEMGTVSMPAVASPAPKIPPTPANGNGDNSGKSGSNNGHKVRDHLCQIIRQHKLDPELVKAYALDFCGTAALKDATREMVEEFVQHLADSAEKDRDALVCHLNGYARRGEEVVA